MDSQKKSADNERVLSEARDPSFLGPVGFYEDEQEVVDGAYAAVASLVRRFADA